MRGGYQIIDMSTLTVLDGSETVKGAFAKAKKGRPILVENCVRLSGFTYDANPASTTEAELPIIGYVSGTLQPAKLVISSDDEVSLATI